MKTKHRRSRGNVRRQKIRRKARMSEKIIPLEERVELIDGNMSRLAVAYCEHYEAFLSKGLMETHRCRSRQCRKLVMFDE